MLNVTVIDKKNPSDELLETTNQMNNFKGKHQEVLF